MQDFKRGATLVALIFVIFVIIHVAMMYVDKDFAMGHFGILENVVVSSALGVYLEP